MSILPRIGARINELIHLVYSLLDDISLEDGVGFKLLDWRDATAVNLDVLQEIGESERDGDVNEREGDADGFVNVLEETDADLILGSDLVCSYLFLTLPSNAILMYLFV